MYLCLTIHFLATPNGMRNPPGESTVHMDATLRLWSRFLQNGESRNIIFGIFTASHVVVLENPFADESCWILMDATFAYNTFLWLRFLYLGLGMHLEYSLCSYILFIVYTRTCSLNIPHAKLFLQRWFKTFDFHILFAGCSFFMTVTLK